MEGARHAIVLPIGSELEDGTLSLLLSQPITRLQLWLQKFAVSVTAVVTASLAFTVVWRSEVFPRFPTVLWVLVALCAGPYCALIARSVRGALALNIIGITLVFIWLQLSLWLHVEMVVVLWALLMLALGVRKMTRLDDWRSRRRRSFDGGAALAVVSESA
jgi:ABC-type transport system involved in multi-copper enzyme maturation permease subunit